MSIESCIVDSTPVVVTGVRGARSTAFRRKFRTFAAFLAWADTEAASDYEVHEVAAA